MKSARLGSPHALVEVLRAEYLRAPLGGTLFSGPQQRPDVDQVAMLPDPVGPCSDFPLAGGRAVRSDAEFR